MKTKIAMILIASLLTGENHVRMQSEKLRESKIEQQMHDITWSKMAGRKFALLQAKGLQENRPGISDHQGWKKVRAIVTHYCAAGCGHKICGGNATTACGRSAYSGDGVAVDPRGIAYGSLVKIGDRIFIADDTGGAMRKDFERGLLHVDVRMSGLSHREVRKMGRSWEIIFIKERRK